MQGGVWVEPGSAPCPPPPPCTLAPIRRRAQSPSESPTIPTQATPPRPLPPLLAEASSKASSCPALPPGGSVHSLCGHGLREARKPLIYNKKRSPCVLLCRSAIRTFPRAALHLCLPHINSKNSLLRPIGCTQFWKRGSLGP